MSTSPSRPDSFDLVVFGTGHPDWLEALDAKSDMWAGLPEIASVRYEDSNWDGAGDPTRRLVLPLLEPDIENCPPGWGLMPSGLALETLRYKDKFARFIAANGLESYAPKVYEDVAYAPFPCVLKRTDLYASFGVKVVFSVAEIAYNLGQDLWAGHPFILQEYIPADIDYTTHGVALNGELLFQKTYAFARAPDSLIRIPRYSELVGDAILDEADLTMLRAFLKASNFTGPFNTNFRRRDSGEGAMIEINPRLGGSLFRPSRRADVTAVVETIVRNAVWYEPR